MPPQPFRWKKGRQPCGTGRPGKTSIGGVVAQCGFCAMLCYIFAILKTIDDP
jgi:hypothetical protein